MLSYYVLLVGPNLIGAGTNLVGGFWDCNHPKAHCMSHLQNLMLYYCCTWHANALFYIAMKQGLGHETVSNKLSAVVKVVSPKQIVNHNLDRECMNSGAL